jgi:hypothetical protein
MPRVRCPGCDTVMKISDDGQTVVRCPACGMKSRLNESPDRNDRDYSEKRERHLDSRPKPLRGRKSEPKKKGHGFWFLPLLILLPPCLVLLVLTPFSKLAACLGMFVGTGVGIVGVIKVYHLFQRKGLTDLNDTLPWILRGAGAMFLSQIYYAFKLPRTVGVWVAVEMLALVLAVMGGVFFQLIKDPEPPNPLGVNQQAANNVGNPGANPAQPAPPSVTGDAKLDKALADLAGDNSVAWQVAADQLAKMKPNQHRAIIAQKLAERATTPELFPRLSIIQALGVWATPLEVPVLIDALRDENIQARSEAFRSLAKTRDKQAVAPLVHAFVEGTNRFEAEEALKELGPLAEKELLPILDKDQDMFLRIATINILREIGTQESIPALKAVIAENVAALKFPAQDAIKAINGRMRLNKGK